ncbi:zinc ribbon domain-containing protein [Aquimarina algicola]|uniref:Zinc ribbon domain-containing protein n=1 Tax=Aquimarina algicola TaxID=2589995 RepID=A0A504J609_9FLAO|nr:zinc ribbon domain-containing protein [Aquimarina algicola]TPN86316.1 zinc ribbon domain-containing protein [Aquimarina algicola]
MFWNTPEEDNDHYESYKQKVIQLKTKFHEEIDYIRSVAQTTVANWHEYLKTVEVTPVGETQRKQAQDTGLPVPKIAFPSEYRAVLVILDIKMQHLVDDLANEMRKANANKTLDLLEEFVSEYLDRMIVDELKRYLDASKPKISVSDIFANASTSLNKYSTKEVGDKSYSIKCSSCGAARLEEDQYDECFYCGTPLFSN